MFNDKLGAYGQPPMVGPEDFEQDETPDLGFTGEDPGVDEELWAGGPLVSMVMSWKGQFGEGNVFVSEIADEMFVWRTLNRFEYKAILSAPNTDPLQREEMISASCVLWHQNFPAPFEYDMQAQGKAGIPARLAELIMEKSGFDRNVRTRAL